MNILVIGNGFDLAHELPTKYTHFLFFCNIALEIIKENHIEVPENKVDYIKWIKDTDKDLQLIADDTNKFVCNECAKNITERDKRVYRDILYKYFISNFFNENCDQELIKEIFYLIHSNLWVEYFLQCNTYQKENWIDFESEISEVIQSLDDDMHGLSQVYNIEDVVYDLSNSFLKEKYSDYIDAVQPINPVDNGFSEGISVKEIRNKLLNDLNRLIRALEIYLCDYVEKIEIEKKSPDIGGLEFDFILSFNYTHIFSKLYNVSSQFKKEVADQFDYLHGEAKINNNIETNNMVLGIDEYLPDDRKNKDIEFIAFKKFYQRIYKGTGSKYKDWINAIREENNIYMERKHDCEIYLENIEVLDHKKEEMRVKLKQLNENPPRHNLYIFGHSLDVTDKDILRDLILIDNVHTTIFYYNKDTMGQQITNLVKVIGQDELIRRTGGSTKTIKFKLQQDMVSTIN